MARMILLFVALATLAVVLPAQPGKTLKAGALKQGQVVLQARKTAFEEDEQRFTAEYVAATMSFEFGTRDEMKAVRNDWDICLQGLGRQRSPFFFAARTVVDDESKLWDLGRMPLEKVSRRTPRPREQKGLFEEVKDDCLLAREGHCYLVHTVDGDSDLWAAFRVLEIRPGEGVHIEWRLIGTPKKLPPASRRRG